MPVHPVRALVRRLLSLLQLKEKRVYDVKVIVQNITNGARNELEKLRAIWVWLCHNIGASSAAHACDDAAFTALTQKKCVVFPSSLRRERVPGPDREADRAGGGDRGRPRRVLRLLQPLHGHVPVRRQISRQKQCDVVNLVHNALCKRNNARLGCVDREVGIECQEVPGHSKGIGYRQGQSLEKVKSDHLWNAVLLGGQWFLLDACWGAGRVDMEHQSFVKRFEETPV